MEFKQFFETLLENKNLSIDEAKQLMQHIMNGEFTDIQISAILTALRMKGETADEIAGFSEAMQSLSFPIKPATEAIDIVGTGGAEFKTFNVSTMSGLVLSSMGIPVAKHGNRSNTSKCGSADFLEALGINLRLDPKNAYNLYNELNFVYLFAPFYHRSMKHAITTRKQLQARTVFNILGPLTNPMKVKYQLIGVFDPHLLRPIAHSLVQRGHKQAAIVYNRNGADEILNNGITEVVELRDGKIDKYQLTVDDFGLDELDKHALRNRNIQNALLEASKLIKGEITPIAEFVAINSAMAMRIKGINDDLVDNTERVLKHIETGALEEHFLNLITQSGGKLPVFAQTIL